MTSEIILVETTVDQLVVNEQKSLDIIEIGIQGPAGIGIDGVDGLPGDGGTTVISIIAGENLAPFRALVSESGKAFLADKDTITDRDKLLGLVDSRAYVINNLANIYVSGVIENPAWDWGDGLIYINNDGALTQILPTTGFLVQAGIAVNPTSMLIDMDRIIEDHDHDPEYINVEETISGGDF